MPEFLVFLSIVLPVAAALVVWFMPVESMRRLVVYGTGAVLAVVSIAMAMQGSFEIAAASLLGIPLNAVIVILDVALLVLILLIALRAAHPLTVVLALLQIAGIVWLEFFSKAHAAVAPNITADPLSLVMVLVISIVGGIICIYGLGYMKEHEEHLHLTRSRQPRFFFFMLMFLGAMNGLVLANNLYWLYFFWEVTTLCSFMLISHDGTDEAKKNALRALWMNMLGGAAFVGGLLMLHRSLNGMYMTSLLNHGVDASILIPVALLCFAGFTKAAQLPFQSWLCGAMVAPTPVSALLHSSTMVKAGVYLVLRLAPAYAGTTLTILIALAGAFTFIVTSALAVGQSNGKKILAYSTIANLGLIVACAGINSAASIAAAIMIIVFHAVSKGLLFLCVGAAEQRIGSRDIENMRGLYQVMPRTAVVMVIGIATMMLPPFGMLLGKWIALESALMAGPAMPALVVFIALGSALTVLFWGRWAGSLLGAIEPSLNPPAEQQECSIRMSLYGLTAGAIILSLAAPLLYLYVILPIGNSYTYLREDLSVFFSPMTTTYSVYTVYALFVILGAGAAWAWREAKRSRAAQGGEVVLPYMSGIQSYKDGEMGFTGPMLAFVKADSSNYYLRRLFGERRLTIPANTVAIVLIALFLFGGAL